MMAKTLDPKRATAQWLHLLLLLALVSVLEAGRHVLSSDNPLTLSLYARSLYIWLPALAGISISIAGPHSRITQNGLIIATTIVALMIFLDVSGTLTVEAVESAALFPDASVSPMAQASQLVSVSWVRTATAWFQGDLEGANRVSQTYDLDHPRLMVANAVTGGGLILVVFASVGFVIATMSWVRAHVLFKRVQDARTFYIVLAWLVAPAVVELSTQFAGDQRFQVLFRGAALWRPLIPQIVILCAALVLWWYTARYRESEDE